MRCMAWVCAQLLLDTTCIAPILLSPLLADMVVLQLPAPVKVMSMFLNRKGNILLVNCSDKVIRMLKVRPRAEGAKLYSHEELKAVLSSTEVGCMCVTGLGPWYCQACGPCWHVPGHHNTCTAYKHAGGH